MICSACGVVNSADSKFCKECGRQMGADSFPTFIPTRTVAEAPPEERDAHVRRLLEMAFWHSDAGNDGAALKAAQSALSLDPQCVSALSLLGCIYERTGEPEQAIEAFERIVEINPASTADVDKLDALRRGIHMHAVPQPPSYRWIPPAMVGFVTRYPSAPMVAGLAGAFVVVFLGLLVMLPIMHGVSNQKLAQGVDTSRYAAAASIMPSLSPAPAAAAHTAGPNVWTVGQPPQNEAAGSIAYAPRTEGDPFANVRADMNRVRMDDAGGAARGGMPGPLPPVPGNAPVPSALSIRPISDSPAQNAVDTGSIPDHVVDVPATSAPTTPATQPASSAPDPAPQPASSDPAPPASYIRITFDGPAHGDVPGDAPGAARAGSIGEDQGGSYQQQAISLQNKGQYRDAEAAYRSAIEAYRADLSAGRNTDFAHRGIDACETGIQICRASE